MAGASASMLQTSVHTLGSSNNTVDGGVEGKPSYVPSQGLHTAICSSSPDRKLWLWKVRENPIPCLSLPMQRSHSWRQCCQCSLPAQLEMLHPTEHLPSALPAPGCLGIRGVWRWEDVWPHNWRFWLRLRFAGPQSVLKCITLLRLLHKTHRCHWLCFCTGST